MVIPSVVGEGTYGCVHKPPMKCKNKTEVVDPTIASKLMKDRDAQSEMSEFKLIEDADKDELFHLGKPSICKVDDTQSNKDAMVKCRSGSFKPDLVDQYSLLLIKYGGLDLEKYGAKLKEMTVNMANRRIVEHFWMDMSRIIFSLKVMNDKGAVHHDLKHQNIVYNQDNGRANLIDFGLMTTKKHIQTASNNSKYGFATLHWSFPVEIELLNKNMFDYVINTKSTKTEYFKKVLDHIQVNHKYFFNCIIASRPESPPYKLDLKMHITNYLQMLTMLQPDDYDKFKNKCIDTIDTYGAGIGLLYVLNRSTRFLSDELYNDLHALFLSMVHQNVFLRISPDELVTRYENILLTHGLLEKYHMKFENHMLVEGSPTAIDIEKNVQKIINSNLSMTPKQQDAFMKSIVIKCPHGKELNPKTSRCVKKCEPGFARNDQFKCRTKFKNRKRTTLPKSVRSKKIKTCPNGSELNTKTGRCNKTCKRGYKRNPDFKCVRET